MNLSRVQQSLCDLFAKVHNLTCETKMAICKSRLFCINKRLYVVSDDYWSSTTDASNTSDAWLVNFNNGNDNWNNKSNTNYVRCVRDNDEVFYV